MEAELSALKPSELTKRAAAQGIAQASIDRAAEGDNSKEELINLILRHAAASQKATSKTKSEEKSSKVARRMDNQPSLRDACCVVCCTLVALTFIAGAVCMYTRMCRDAWILLSAMGVGIEGQVYRPPIENSVTHLSSDTFADIVGDITQSEQTIIVEFFAPWCGHCKKLAPVWSQFAGEIAIDPEQNSTIKVAQVDCPANRAICDKHGVEGFPTIKYYNKDTPPLGTTYEGQRQSVEQLLDFASTLRPRCSHSRMDLCSESELGIIEGYLELSAQERKDLIDSAEEAIKKVVDEFDKAIIDLNERYSSIEKERESTINYYHDKEFTLLQSIVKEDAELFADLYPDSSLEVG